MHKWVASDPILNGQMVALGDIPKSYEDDARPGHNEIFLHDDGVEAQNQIEFSAKLIEFIGDVDYLMQRCIYERDCNCFCCVGTFVLRILIVEVRPPP